MARTDHDSFHGAMRRGPIPEQRQGGF